MPALRERPQGSANFLVEIGTASGRSQAAGFAEVIFPPFAVEDGTGPIGGAGPPMLSAIATGQSANRRLVLRRGATGALDLYDWWDQARLGKAPRRRVVKVKLLADDQSTVVLTWRFSNVRPMSLAYSPLDAMAGAVLMETIELSFDSVEMSAG